MSKNFLKKINEATDKLNIALERVGLGKQTGFTKERPPREVLLHWKAVQSNSIISQGDLQNIYNSSDPAI